MDQTNLIYGLVFLVLVIIAVIIVSSRNKNDETWKKDIITKVGEIASASNSKDTMVLSAVVINADKLLDHTMKMRRIPGDTMGDRLKRAKGYFDKNLYNRIWEAHKLRNQLAHEHNVTLKVQQAQEAIHSLLSGIRHLLR